MDGALTQENASFAKGVANRLLGAFYLMQPQETILMQALPAALFMWVAWPAAGLGRLATLFLAVVAIYGSVGALNDYCDYDLDKAAKPNKPLVRGLASLRFALWQSLILAIAGLALSLALNPLTAGFSLLILLLGAWYDMQAKRSVLSWVPYAIGIPVLPLWGFAAAGRFERMLLLAFPLGAMLSLALNISQTLPDHATDAAFGLKALTHRLKLEHAIALEWTLFAAAILGFAASAPLVGNRWDILGPGLAAGVGILAIMIGDYAIFRSIQSLKRNWIAGAMLGVVVGLGWVASLPRH